MSKLPMYLSKWMGLVMKITVGLRSELRATTFLVKYAHHGSSKRNVYPRRKRVINAAPDTPGLVQVDRWGSV